MLHTSTNETARVVRDLCMSCRVPVILFYSGAKWQNPCTILVQEFYFILFYCKWANHLSATLTSLDRLQSSNTNLLTIPFANITLGGRSFSVSSPKICNSLPPALRSCNCPDTFYRHLKTHYFQQSFSSPRHLSPCASESAFADIAGVYTYLLSYAMNRGF